MAVEKKKKKKEENREGLHWKDIFQGRFISHDFLARYWRQILMMVILLLVYITNRYSCQQKIAEISRLQRQLTDVRFEALTITSTLLGSSRQSQVKALILERGLLVEESKQPPFVIVRDK